MVEQDGGGQKTYTDDAALLAGLFSIEEVFPVDAARRVHRPLYVSARAQFEPVRLMPPLTLVSHGGRRIDGRHPMGPGGRPMKGAVDRAAMAENTSRGLIILVLLFVVLIGIIIAFSRTFITTITGADPAAATIALVAALALPLVLLGITVFQIARLLRQRALRLPGAGLRLRLLLFFVLISVLSAGPQAMLGIFFVNSAMGTWFSSSIGDALRGALNLSIDYQKGIQEQLAAFIGSPLTPRLLQDFTASPGRSWPEIQSLNPTIAALQVFSADGRSAAFGGDARARLSSALDASGRDDREGVTILRRAQSLTVGGTRITAVASALLSADLRANVRKLTQSLTIFTALDQYGRLFRIALVGFFFLFSLPIFFITILVSLLLTERIISPIAHLEDATRRVAEGDFSFRILTRPRDELSALVDSFNGMISELERSRRKLLQAERITAWQEIAQRLAHEIRNPLTPIKLSAQRMLKKHDEGAPGFRARSSIPPCPPSSPRWTTSSGCCASSASSRSCPCPRSDRRGSRRCWRRWPRSIATSPPRCASTWARSIPRWSWPWTATR